MKQKGFTLVELMIVVAIIGIISAVAVPQYQEYIAKSQTIDAISLLEQAKREIFENLESGSCTKNGKDVNFLSGKYGNIGYTGEPINSSWIDGYTGCYMTYTFNENASSYIADKTIDVLLMQNGSYMTGEETDIDLNLLPKNFFIKQTWGQNEDD